MKNFDEEKNLLKLVLSCRNNNEIAELLGISAENVKTCLQRVYEEYDVCNRVQLVVKLEVLKK